ncbi:hypothetical protein [Parasitella parasitica]|uniref:Coiled-coil domain-containing protein 6 n=1 Tax=Parasitella parasitica TaxID=35722 RepID=A0A0B7NIL5_9FUNG|nr:hypothetical protein [Parasitella parasitica]
MSSLHVEPEEQLATSTTTCAATHYNSSSDKLTFMEGYIRKYIDSDASNKDDYVRYIATLDNIEQLREEAKTLYEKHRQQAARIKKLEFELEMEQGHINILRHGNQTLKKTAIDMSVLTEQEEESISNRLLKHITGLKKEKGELLIQVEQEEEWLTNMLQKKLVQLQKEKIDLENALEQEQEYMVNRLQKQLELLRQQQTSPIPSRHGSSSSSSISASPVVSAGIASPLLGASKKRPTTPTTTSAAATARQLMADPVLPAPPGLVEVLKHELTSLRARALEMEKEELIQFRKEYNLPVEDIDDGRVPRVFRAVHVAPNNEKQGRRSASNSSQRSVTPTASTSIPPLNLDQFESVFINSSHSFVSPQSIPGSSTSRSPSVSSSASSSFQRSSISSSRRVSGSLFGLSATPPQHPPQLPRYKL